MMRKLLFFLPLLAALEARAEESHLVVVSGLGGEAKYSDAFYRWSVDLMGAAEKKMGVPRANIEYLAEDPAKDKERIADKATRENVLKTLHALATKARPVDQVVIVFFGHGSVQGEDSRFNLPGPDLTAKDVALALDELKAPKVAFVNCSSASGDFVPALSGKNRVVVTATKTGMERNETVFGKYFVEAFTGDGADTDKDHRVSILEAFVFAKDQVARFYEEEKRLQTEHAVLDDNGDGKGSTTVVMDAKAADGALARTLALSGGGGAATAQASSDPKVALLYQEKRELEDRIELLKQQKEGMTTEVYQDELEKLLLDLAQKNQSIQKLEGRKPE